MPTPGHPPSLSVSKKSCRRLRDIRVPAGAVWVAPRCSNNSLQCPAWSPRGPTPRLAQPPPTPSLKSLSKTASPSSDGSLKGRALSSHPLLNTVIVTIKAHLRSHCQCPAPHRPCLARRACGAVPPDRGNGRVQGVPNSGSAQSPPTWDGTGTQPAGPSPRAANSTVTLD